MTIHGIEFDENALWEYCRRHHVKKLSLFGSALRDDFEVNSDVDLLIEFAPGQRISLFDLGGMVMDLSEIVGRPVDLRTAEDLSPYFRDDVLQEAKLLYAA